MADIVDPWKENPSAQNPGAGNITFPSPMTPPKLGEPYNNPMQLTGSGETDRQASSKGLQAAASGIVKYGVPAAVAATGAGAIPVGLSMGASHLAGQQIDQGLHTPTAREGVEAGVSTVAGTVGQVVIPPAMNILGAALKWPIAKIAQKVIVQPEMQEAISGGIGAPIDRSKYYLYTWLNQLGSSPTPGQVFKNEWVQFMDQVTSAGIFSGRRSIQEQNAQRLTDAAVDYVNVHARAGWQEPLFGDQGTSQVQQVARSRFGQLMQSVFVGGRNELGEKIPGSLINMQSLINSQNYNAFRRSIADKGLEVNIKPAVDLLEANRELNPHIKMVESKLKEYLPGPAPELNSLGLNVEQAATMAKSGFTEDALNAMAPKARNSLLKQMGMEPAAPVDPTLPMEKAAQFIQEINPLFKSPDKGVRSVAKQLKDTVDEAISTELETSGNTESLQAFNYARKTFGNLADTFDNKLMQGFVEQVSKSPASSLQGILSSGDQKIDMYDGLKKAFLADAKGAHGGGAANFLENVEKPLRYHPFAESLDNSTGQVNGQALYDSLKNKYGQEFGEKVYGADGYEKMLQLAEAIMENDKRVGVGSMFIKGAQTAIVLGGGSTLTERKETYAKLAGVSLLLTPALFSRYFTSNPRATQILIDGIKMGQGSTAWTRAVAAIASEKTGDAAVEKAWTPGQRQVYTDPGAHEIVDPNNMPQPEIQFIPSDTAMKKVAEQQQVEGIPEAPPLVIH